MTFDFTFYLGTSLPTWLWNGKAKGPMFVAAHRMRRKSQFPRATVPFALDSGGFNHLLKEGCWTVTPKEYAAHALRIHHETGNLSWAAVQDWACAEPVLSKTGRTILDHQKLTLESWHELRALAPEVMWMPVLQGHTRDEYLRHVEMYEASGTILQDLDVVGIGSMASRQRSDLVVELLEELDGMGMRLHGFGIKLEGLRRSLPFLRSSDSMAWSWHARLNKGDRNGQVDAEQYRTRIDDEVRKTQEYVDYEGIFEFFGGEDRT